MGACIAYCPIHESQAIDQRMLPTAEELGVRVRLLGDVRHRHDVPVKKNLNSREEEERCLKTHKDVCGSRARRCQSVDGCQLNAW